MRRVRVYVDTSVFGGTQDEEFAESSRRFFALVRRGEFEILVSRMLLREIGRAPESVRRVLADLDAGCLRYVDIGEEVEALADAYVSAGILGSASRDDAVHVAAATVAGADLVLSWNFKHIVNYDRIHKYNAINLLNGYRQIEIRSPMEVACGGEDEDI